MFNNNFDFRKIFFYLAVIFQLLSLWQLNSEYAESVLYNFPKWSEISNILIQKMGKIKINCSFWLNTTITCYIYQYSAVHSLRLSVWIKVGFCLFLYFKEVNHLEQQLEEANSVRRELDDAFRQIKASEKQIKTLQQEREELNKVNIYEWILKAVCTCFIFYN